MLEKALADVRQRRIDLQADFDRVKAELMKLQMAERALAAIVEGESAEAEGTFAGSDPAFAGERPVSGRATGRGSRGPRANSAKGRLKALLEETGLQGLSHAEISRRLPDVAPATLNAYLSTMVTSGEAVRRGDFYSAGRPPAEEDDPSEDDEDQEGAED